MKIPEQLAKDLIDAEKRLEQWAIDQDDLPDELDNVIVDIQNGINDLLSHPRVIEQQWLKQHSGWPCHQDYVPQCLEQTGKDQYRWKGYTIERYWLPYAKWSFGHDDYDGPGDNRCGLADRLVDCVKEIQEIEAEREEIDELV